MSKGKDKKKDKGRDAPRPAAGPPAAPDLVARLLPWAAVLLIMIAAAAIRVRLLNVPLERDEGEYAYAGQLMLEGVPPYSLAYNMKFPGIYAAYAAIMAVFGQTVAGVHLGLIVVNLAAIVLVFLLGRRLVNAWAGATAAAAYAVLSISPTVLGLAGHATHFVVLAALGGLLLLLRGLERNGRLMFLWSGLCLGAAVLMKQPGAAFAVAAGLYLVWAALTTRPVRWLRSAAQLGLLAAGTLLPFGLTCLVLWWAGVFDKFWFWTFKYAAQYAAILSFDTGMEILNAYFWDYVGPAAGLWVLAALGLAGVIVAAVLRRTRKAADAAFFLAALLALSVAATGAGFYWRNHYFILMLPAVALLAGAAVGLVWELTKGWWKVLVALPLVAFVGCFGYAVYAQRAEFFTMTPVEVCRAMYGPNPFPESLEIAQYIRDNTQEGDRIAVIGSEPQIYFYAHRRSATGHIYTYGLMEPQAFALTMQKEMEEEIQKNKPKYIVVVSPHPGLRTSWLWYPDRSNMELFGWMDDWVRSRYHVEGLVLIGAVQAAPQVPVEWRDTWLWNTKERAVASLEAAQFEKQLAEQWAFQQDVLQGRRPAPAPPAKVPQFWSDLFLGRAHGAAGPAPRPGRPGSCGNCRWSWCCEPMRRRPSGARGRKPCTAPNVSSTNRTSATRSATDAAGPICPRPTSTWASWSS